MLFNSFEFFVFLVAVIVAIRVGARGHIRLRNTILLVASYVFYGWWSWRFLVLLVFSSALDYLIGLGLDRWTTRRLRHLLMVASLLGNLGLLGIFKYADFFLSSLRAALEMVGLVVSVPALRLVLPVGISFYTFQKLSYVFDVYAGRIPAVRDPLAFFTFVSFFPQLVAGPIERAGSLLPQFLGQRTVTELDLVEGLRCILWGLFKKVVVADRLAAFVNAVYATPAAEGGARLLLATCAFGFQVYGDFSGYSDIARGTARLLGFELMVNFRRPYLATSVREFWSRWHISLSTWFRDYVYVPLGGNRVGPLRWVANILGVFMLSGLWHGASWTFVLWGLLHGLYLVGGRALRPFRDRWWSAVGPFAVHVRKPAGMMATFLLVSFGWGLFRSPTLAHTQALLQGVLGLNGRDWMAGVAELDPVAAVAVGVLVVAECWAEWMPPRWRFDAWPAAARWIVYAAAALSVLNFGAIEEIPFMYFQF